MPLRAETIHIESQRLSIRPFSAGDARDAFGCITHSLTRFMSWEPPADRSEFDQIWQGWISTIAEGTDYTFVIRRRDGGFIGLAGLHDVQHARAVLGIWVREDSHAQGFGREAVSAVARWASTVLGVESFTYPVAEQNHPSRRIAESLGGVVVDRKETPKYRAVIYRIPDQAAR
ncbi:GNAT family N-acetyltransferase [Burkholderia glumae]|uniref:GNAT family N-acetyltransferase n=1 Tax=Burkholderia glumae TaxID=337 RepID=A0AAP9Y0B3_BURGL|nr:GNAT family N-acetyltransferase [Burkholderia glumae]ACR30619.1 GCN5-like N-acetyltransferase [Burkholderia glumae BGR1]AJY63174.1 acetyltransferase family protein [Burkholderia glumae LMG 2196 = ATCC 33617]KHJ64979.1 acetyltransferase [Burkholderia glumae]MCM2539543.1 GNAT family N-acetyltransferase [Burkholderia glumae]MCM2551162.1 GNAT family N-acetyltransferase [Burkholderia glumae]